MALSLSLLAGLASGADWLHFRGSDTSGVSTEAGLPTTWSATENVAWQTALPGRGVSSPIVVGGKVIVTSSSGFRDDKLHVVCVDAGSGQIEWHRQFWATGRSLHHPTSSNAAPSPTSDGRRVYAFFSSNDLVCIDLDGTVRWVRGLTYDFPTAVNDVGMSSSPVVVDDTVIVQVECKGDSFSTGIDAKTGETHWQLPRLKEMNWCSPALMPLGDGRQAVLLQSPDRLTAHDPRTGKELWAHVEACSSIPSATADKNLVLVPAAGLTALRAGASGTPEVLWKENRLAPGNSSPVTHGERVYVINRGGVLVAGNLSDGDVAAQLRLGGSFWATPIVAGDHLYAANEAGVTYVVKLGDKPEIVAKNELGEPVLGTPAVGGGALFIRSDGNLWKIAGGK
ncbi:MAG: PQQ-binding-like beta-propeller repeat protein [Pirellulales bacterium]|nr:PQQ-binding-like beta-propeller repeat protein [Pirellulales bacterium]